MLYDYWVHVGREVPYFFPTSHDAWTRCLFHDKDGNDPLFASTHVYVAFEDDNVVGFIQYGKPSFHYNSKGQKILNPEIAVIRHLYFEENRLEIGEALLDQAKSYYTRFEEAYAFYHAFGMSCNAYHGKLHQGATHVASVLEKRGFNVRHENVYYVLPLEQWQLKPSDKIQVRVKFDRAGNLSAYSAYRGNQLVGSAEVRYLDHLTGGTTTNVAYMTWIGIEPEFRRTGLGTCLLGHIIENLRDHQCDMLHLDTAANNHVAHRFYERLGFSQQGVTRDYVYPGPEGEVV